MAGLRQPTVLADELVRKAWLQARGYRQLPAGDATKFSAMQPGTFSFRMNVPVKLDGGKLVNIPVDAVIMPLNRTRGQLPIFIEAKSAGDFTNTNKRGIATGDNSFFILSEQELEARSLPKRFFRPILPSPRHVGSDEVISDEDGVPCLDKRLFLLDPGLPEDEIERQCPALWSYLQEGKAKGLHERYLCRHRSLWYAQEGRPPAPIVCTYLGRGDSKSGRPFRFIRNRSAATVANVYLAMYPTPLMERALAENPALLDETWHLLNQIEPDQLLGEGRVYGGGLHKLEPRELAQVPLTTLAGKVEVETPQVQLELIDA